MKRQATGIIQWVKVMFPLLTGLCAGPAISGNLPATHDSFSPAGVWHTDAVASGWIDAWHNCSDINCIVAYMKKSGASKESMDITLNIVPKTFESAGFLETFEEKGRVDLGSLALPFRANTNRAFVMLNGTPALVSTELADPGRIVISSDSNYPSLKQQYPQLELWGSGAEFVSSNTGSDGGQRFIFDYDLVNDCHACQVGWKVYIAFDFSKNGTFKGSQFLKLVRDESAVDSSEEVTH